MTIARIVAIAAAYPTRLKMKRVLVHVHRRDDRRVAGPAGGRVVDHVEAAERVDRRQHERDEDLVAEAGQSDGEELAEGARSVDARRVVELERDLCTPATKSTMQSPNVTHVPMTPIDGSAHVKSPSHGRTSEPRPTTSRNRLSGPLAS